MPLNILCTISTRSTLLYSWTFVTLNYEKENQKNWYVVKKGEWKLFIIKAQQICDERQGILSIQFVFFLNPFFAFVEKKELKSCMSWCHTVTSARHRHIACHCHPVTHTYLLDSYLFIKHGLFTEYEPHKKYEKILNQCCYNEL